MPRFTIDLPPDLNEYVSEQATAANLSKNQFIAWLITHFKNQSEYERGFNLAIEALCEFERRVREEVKADGAIVGWVDIRGGEA